MKYKADSTLRASRAVPHPSTDRALCRLTSEVERDPVHSTRYGRQREFWLRPRCGDAVSNHSTARQWEGEQRWSYTPQDLASGAAVALKLCISSLHSGVRFGLLCCQPEPVPGSLPARIPQLTLQYPCGPLA